MDFKALRAKRNDKARSLIESSGGKVDSSTWTPDEMLNADVKTGMRPISRRAFKTGGKVEGENAKSNLSRSPRGFKETVGLANTNQKDANEEREGKKHVGGFKNGGRTGMMAGGLPIKQKGQSAMKGTDDYDPMYEYNPVEDPEGDKKRRADRGQAALEEEQRRMGDMTRRKDGGKAEKFEGSAKDIMEDKKMAAKHGMSMKEWEASSADKKHDSQHSMKGMKTGGRTAKMGGGEMAAVAPVASKMVKDPKKAIAGGLLAGMKKGGAAHGDDCSCKACGGSAGYKDGGGLYANINAKRASGEEMRKPGEKGAPSAQDFKDAAKTAKKEHGGRMGRATGGRTKGTTNISINVMPHTPNKPMGIQPPMPPMPPVGGPPPMGGMPPPPPMPPRGGGGLPPGLMAAMSGASGDGPPPPPSMGMPPPPMGRKAGGKVYPIDSGAGGAKARLDKIKAYGLKQK